MERNSRYSNAPRLKNGKPVAVQLRDRDFAIFDELSTFGMARATFIHTLVGGEYTSVRDRLCLLNNKPNEYLDKPPQFKETANPDEQQPNRNYQPLVYFLAGRGWTELEKRGLSPNYRRIVQHPGRGKYREFDHDLMASDVVISIKGSAKERGLRFISSREVIARAPEATQQADQPLRMELPDTKTDKGKPRHVIPDGLFRLAYPKQDGTGELFQSFLVEIDRGTMPSYRSDYSLSSLERKVVEYRELFDADIPAKHLNLKKPHLLIISNDPGQIERTRQRMIEKKLTDPRIHLLALPGFGRPDRAPKPALDILDRPFTCAGHRDTYLNHPFLKGGEFNWTSNAPASSSQRSKSDAPSSPASSEA